MPDFVNIVINDGAATPVARTFSPNAQTGLEASYAERSSGISMGFPMLKVNMVQANRTQPLNKVRSRLNIPKLETISGSSSAGFTPAPRLAYQNSSEVNFIFHERATEQERKDTRILTINYLLSAVGIATIDKLEPIN